jgi:hypothetical protein
MIFYLLSSFFANRPREEFASGITLRSPDRGGDDFPVNENMG